ncbi:MAG: leucine-rich repeat protein [Erysipelotrichales bacterium]|nr:leucine-rich repeat protein [Erysipelotrichales bacterium]
MKRKIYALFLAAILIVQMLPINPVFALDKNSEEKISVTFSSVSKEKTEIISLVAAGLEENIIITGIKLPDGKFVEGGNVEYIATENGKYNFEVFYKQVITSETPQPTDTDKSIVIDANSLLVDNSNEASQPADVVEESKTFTYEVTRLSDDKVPPLEENVSSNGEGLLNSNLNPSPYVGEEWFVFNPDTQTIIGYSSSLGAPKDIVIPEQIGGIDVLHIGDNAFSGQQLTSIVLNSKIQTIGKNAFRNNKALTEILLPNTITSIGAGAFAECASLTTMTLPDAITVIEDSLFAECLNLETVNFPNTITRIGRGAFTNCKKLVSIDIPNTVTEIGSSAFFNCFELTSIVVPEGVTAINDSAFFACKKLENVTLPNTLTRIGASAFADTWKLASITIPDNLTSIGNSAFQRSAFTEITLPATLTQIGDNAFAQLGVLKTIDISSKPSGSIAGEPWGSVTATVIWSDTIVEDGWVYNLGTKTIVKYTGTETDLVVPTQFTRGGTVYPVEKLGDGLFLNNKIITSVVLPDGLIEIPKSAFEGCIKLTNVTIPNTVEKISSGAFSKCTALKSISLPDSITVMDYSAFNSCTSLTEVTLPSGLKRLEPYTFAACYKLEKITLNEGLEVIANNVFGETALAEITIPNSVIRIHAVGLAGMKNLTAIKIPTKNSGEISDAPWGSNATVYWKDSNIGSDWVFDVKSGIIQKYVGTDTDVTIPEKITVDGVEYDVKGLGIYAFRRNTTITSVTIPDIITEIPKQTFEGCTNLTTVNFPSTLTMIGNAAFKDCPKLTNVELPKGLKHIDDAAFMNCTSITSIEFPENILRLGHSSFQNTGLVEVTIPNSVIALTHDLFNGCKNLEMAILPNALISVGARMFENTPKLKSIHVMSSRDATLSVIKNAQPWGAYNTVKVKYLGEFIEFYHTLDVIPSEFARNINLKASMLVGNINVIIDPQGNRINVGASNWERTFKVTANQEYTFIGIDASGEEVPYVVEINDIGLPTLTVKDTSIHISETKSLTKEKLLSLVNAIATTVEKGVDFSGGVINISDAELAKVQALSAHDEKVSIIVTAVSPTGLSNTKKVTITAVGIRKVTFEANGGMPVPPTQEIIIGQKIAEPGNPTKSGYNFKGWYSDSALTTIWNFASDTMPAADITLYAKWEKVVIPPTVEPTNPPIEPTNPPVKPTNPPVKPPKPTPISTPKSLNETIIVTPEKDSFLTNESGGTVEVDDAKQENILEIVDKDSQNCILHWIFWVISGILLIIMFIKRIQNKNEYEAIIEKEM